MIQFKLISVYLDVLQQDSATLVDVCSAWLGLMKKESLQTHIETVEKRMSQSLEPLHFSAYLLHPKYQGDGLNIIQTESAPLWATKNFIIVFLS